MFYPPELEAYRPLEAKPPEEGTFEIALVLAGAVSAGAYTAGVLDFLIEALDEWHRQRIENNINAPGHQVVLKAVTGASAGGICGALLAAAGRYAFVPARYPKDRSQPDIRNLNPFWKPWVKDINLDMLLGTHDLDSGIETRSILDTTVLRQLAKDAVSYRTDSFKDRPYMADPWKLLLTLTNLRGVPYEISLQSNTSLTHSMRCHADFVRFAIGKDRTKAAPDELFLDPDSRNTSEWTILADAALATGAFPAFLSPVLMYRNPTFYDFRFVPVPGEDRVLSVKQIKPSWKSTPNSYSFLCVDGGAVDNEPLELARIELAGLLGRNPRDGKNACRAVLMIDPFSETQELGPSEHQPLLKTVMDLTAAWKSQARFKPVDAALAIEETLYSRYLMTPDRGSHKISGDTGESFSLVSGGLGAFLGFFHQSFREHDFQLGRRNCQRFLSEHFTLPEENDLFKNGRWTEDQKKQFRVDGATGPELPIIPLMGTCKDEIEPLPKWPKVEMDTDYLKTRINDRVEALYNSLTQSAELGWIANAYLRLGWNFTRATVVQKTLVSIEAALKQRKLI